MNMNYYLSFLLLPSPASRAEEEIDREEDIAGASHPPFTQATAKSQQGLIALSRSSWHGMVDIMFIRSDDYSHHSKAEGSYVAQRRGINNKIFIMRRNLRSPHPALARAGLIMKKEARM